jgi:hypothetical protein
VGPALGSRDNGAEREVGIAWRCGRRGGGCCEAPGRQLGATVPVIRISFAVEVHCRVIQPPEELLSNLIPSENIARGGLHVANGTRRRGWRGGAPNTLPISRVCRHNRSHPISDYDVPIGLVRANAQRTGGAWWWAFGKAAPIG